VKIAALAKGDTEHQVGYISGVTVFVNVIAAAKNTKS
jgi:hypothetical protein